MSVKKLLVANRGEIACRIIRTCREMGINTVAVYSDGDRGAMHVRLAILSHHLGPTPSRESYLALDRLLEICKKTGADALHPGYGFISEDAQAAQHVIESGITWIGPSPESIEIMADKIKAREVARKAGVPVLPAVDAAMGDDVLMRESQQLGFPLMVKPVIGRDGRGMRMVRTPGELNRALPMVKGDALFSFWDEHVYLEKALIKPRHVEVQVFGDMHGNYVHFHDRDSSVQRRYQQLMDEAPAIGISPELRAQMCDAAVSIARAIKYVGAGTVEFLVDEQGHFYFLEMTTRIQGGHPVTEWITGQDMVRWQIKIASGEKLPLKQEEIPMWGHAVLCRINAEDPDRDFAPSSGRLNYLRTPAGHNVRDDNGVYTGWEMNPYYAPLISKLSTWGPTRHAAIDRMASALSEYRIGGVRNNVAFYMALMGYKPYREGNLHTGMLNHPWWKQKGLGPYLKFAVAAALFDEYELEQRRAQQPPHRNAVSKAESWKSFGKFNRV